MKGIQLTTYTPNTPIHGGKIRSKALLAIFAATFGPEISVINLSADQQRRGVDARYRNVEQISDLFTADLLTTSSLEPFKGIDYLVVEQPWGWPIAARLKREQPETLCIYSSQNIESVLKERILMDISTELRAEITSRIRELEIAAAKEADLVIACSLSDQEWFITHGVNPKKVIYIPNCTAADQFAGQVTPSTDETEYFLLAASSYLPTNESFMELFSHANEFLPPKVEIKVVGGIADYLVTQVGSRTANALHGGINLLGVVDDLALHNYLAGALGILLPVKFGGGTNLKTAEALYYNKYIIGTEEAFRGFEKYLDDPKIFIVRDSHDVMRAMWRIYNSSEQSSAPLMQDDKRRELTWSYWREEGPLVIREALSL